MKKIIYLLMIAGLQLIAVDNTHAVSNINLGLKQESSTKTTESELESDVIDGLKIFDEENEAPIQKILINPEEEKVDKTLVETIIQKKKRKRKITKGQTTSNKRVLKIKEKQPRYFYKDFNLLKCLLAILGILFGIQLIIWIYRISVS